MGDSYVNGTGDPSALGWTGRLCAAAWSAGHHVTHYQLGVRRETSADIASRWEAEVQRRLPPDIHGRIVFSFGVNDTTFEAGVPRVEPQATLAYARSILTAAGNTYPVLMVGPPPTADTEQNGRTEQLDGLLAALCGEIGVPYLSVVGPLLQSAEWMVEVRAGDGSHPGAGGYAELAALAGAWPAWQAWFEEPAATVGGEPADGRLIGIDHVQLTMPRGEEHEALARDFYERALGLREVLKPGALRDRGGLWFQGDGFQVHLGIEDIIETRRHPGFLAEDIDAMWTRIVGAGYEVEDDPGLPGVRRFYVRDPFANRIEVQQYVDGWEPAP